MPELPEVETVRAGLESLILDTTIAAVEIRRDSCVRLLLGGAREFAAHVSGLTISEVARRGKYLWLVLVDAADPGRPEISFSAHLGMSGQFRVHDGPWDAAPEPHPHCRARLGLRRPDGSMLTLDFLDQRTFGYLHAEPFEPTSDGHAAGAGTVHPLLPASVAHIGRDALDPRLDARATGRAWRRGSRGVKQVLLDQTLVSGIGNIYADEALWLARVHPERPAHAVTARQAALLLDAVREVMSEALSQGGTSFDALYVNVNGESGYFDRSLHAYARGGEPCDRCGRPLRRAVVGGRSTHWCATCQRRWVPKPRIDAV